MSFADSNLAALRAARETTFNVRPDPFNAKALRVTSSSLSVEKQTETSNELRSDRTVTDEVEVASTTGGQLNFELSLGGTFDDLLEATLCSQFSSEVKVTGAIAVDSATKRFSLAGIGANAVVGQHIFAAGFAEPGNNGWFLVESVAPGYITVADPDGKLVTEVGPIAAKVTGKRLRNGVSRISYAVEQAFLDVSAFQVFTGMMVNQMRLEVASAAKVTGSFSLMGAAATEMLGATATNAVAAPTDTPVVNATGNVGTIRSSGGGSALSTALKSVNIQVENGLRNKMVVGNKYPVEIGLGRQKITGAVEVYFSDRTLYNKFLANQYVDLQFGFKDASGNSMLITLPKIFLKSAPVAPGGVDQDVMLSMDFSVLLNAAKGYQIQVDIANP